MLTKKCYKCKEVLPASLFHKNNYNLDGLQWYCKACCKNNKSNYIYIIKRCLEPLYIGSCNNITKRVSNHVRGSVPTTREYMLHNEWTSIIYVDVSEYVSNKLEREFLEYAMIELMNPKLNILERSIVLNDDSKEEYLMEVAKDLINSDSFKIYKTNDKEN